MIPLTGSRTLVKRLAEELGLRTTVPYRVWFAAQQVSIMTLNSKGALFRDVLGFFDVF